MRHVLAERNCGASVVAEVENSGLDTKPVLSISMRFHRDVTSSASASVGIPSKVPCKSNRDMPTRVKH